MLEKIALALLAFIFGVPIALVGVLMVVFQTRPTTFKIERSVHIGAPAAVVYANLDNPHAWSRWVPWFMPTDMKGGYSGPQLGPGASYAWPGKAKTLMGKATIKSSKTDESVVIDVQTGSSDKRGQRARRPVHLVFATFTLLPSGDGVSVDATMSNERAFQARTLGMLELMLERRGVGIGSYTEEALANLKSASEADAAAMATSPTVPAVP